MLSINIPAGKIGWIDLIQNQVLTYFEVEFGLDLKKYPDVEIPISRELHFGVVLGQSFT